MRHYFLVQASRLSLYLPTTVQYIFRPRLVSVASHSPSWPDLARAERRASSAPWLLQPGARMIYPAIRLLHGQFGGFQGGLWAMARTANERELGLGRIHSEAMCANGDRQKAVGVKAAAEECKLRFSK